MQPEHVAGAFFAVLTVVDLLLGNWLLKKTKRK